MCRVHACARVCARVRARVYACVCVVCECKSQTGNINPYKENIKNTFNFDKT